MSVRVVALTIVVFVIAITNSWQVHAAATNHARGTVLRDLSEKTDRNRLHSEAAAILQSELSLSKAESSSATVLQKKKCVSAPNDRSNSLVSHNQPVDNLQQRQQQQQQQDNDASLMAPSKMEERVEYDVLDSTALGSLLEIRGAAVATKAENTEGCPVMNPAQAVMLSNRNDIKKLTITIDRTADSSEPHSSSERGSQSSRHPHHHHSSSSSSPSSSSPPSSSSSPSSSLYSGSSSNPYSSEIMSSLALGSSSSSHSSHHHHHHPSSSLSSSSLSGASSPSSFSSSSSSPFLSQSQGSGGSSMKSVNVASLPSSQVSSLSGIGLGMNGNIEVVDDDDDEGASSSSSSSVPVGFQPGSVGSSISSSPRTRGSPSSLSSRARPVASPISNKPSRRSK